jgi:hypothetical protein
MNLMSWIKQGNATAILFSMGVANPVNGLLSVMQPPPVTGGTKCTVLSNQNFSSCSATHHPYISELLHQNNE